MVQWLGFHTFTDEGSGLIPDWETKILQALQQGKKKKKKAAANLSLYFELFLRIRDVYITPTHFTSPTHFHFKIV